MELERKVKYALLAVTAAYAVLSGLGICAAVHPGPLEKGGVVDLIRIYG